MDTKLYLTIAAVVAILYALGFLLIPVQTSLFFSGFAEPRAVLNLRFCGAAGLAWGLIVWFARDFRHWDAVRGVLIASVVGLAVDIVINVWATLQGWLNANAWASTVVLVLLLLGGAYQLSFGARKTA
jgi:hypothetical protein